MLFVHFEIGYRQGLFLFLTYELNTVVSVQSDVFYPSTLT